MDLYRKLAGYRDPQSWGSRLRARRLWRLRGLLEDLAAVRCRKLRIIDLGGRRNYWALVGEDILSRTVQEIHLVNSEVIPPPDHPLFTAAPGDACALPQYADGSFDLVHSNSVIEHVGDWSRMLAFAGEVRRLAPSYYVQTPNFWFPFEPHFGTPFFHWLPEQVRYRLLLRFKLGWFERRESVSAAMTAIQSARLLDTRQLCALLPDARIERDRLGFLTKSLLAIRRGQDVHFLKNKDQDDTVKGSHLAADDHAHGAAQKGEYQQGQ